MVETTTRIIDAMKRNNQRSIGFCAVDARFRKPSSNIKAPTSTATIPSANTICGGLMIFTSSPYAACHQSSKRADVIIAMPPHAAMNAPSGP